MNTRLMLPLLAAALLMTAQTASAKCFRATVCDDKGENCRSEQVCPAYKEHQAELKTRALKEAPAPSEGPTSLLPAPPLPPSEIPLPLPATPPKPKPQPKAPPANP